jgi:hypothetical protein
MSEERKADLLGYGEFTKGELAVLNDLCESDGWPIFVRWLRSAMESGTRELMLMSAPTADELGWARGAYSLAGSIVNDFKDSVIRQSERLVANKDT